MRPVLALALLSACSPGSALMDQGRTLYVEPAADGEWDDYQARRSTYTTLADAIAAASPGDTIEIPSGTYTEPGLHTMLQHLTIDGAGIDETLLITEGLRINGETGVIVSDLSLMAETEDLGQLAGILDDNNGNDFINVGSSGYRNGILLTGGGATVDGGHYRNNRVGITLDGAVGTTVTNVLASGNRDAGIKALGGAEPVAITMNTVVDNGHGSPAPEFAGGMPFEEAYGVTVNNIVVGNSQGLIAIDGGGFESNLVWGNTIDYAWDVGPSGSDLDLDPLFVSASEGDYHLQAGSPAIDTAGESEADWVEQHDADGLVRPNGGGYDMGRHEFIPVGSASSTTLWITEVMANPLIESRDEYVEVYNYGTVAIDLRGLVISDGDSDDTLTKFFDAPTLLAPGEYAVIIDPQYSYNLDFYGIYQSGSGVTMYGTGDNTVGNGLTTTDEIRLYDTDGVTVIDSYGFASNPGDGVSRERIEPGGGDVSGNWADSNCSSGHSAGAAACFTSPGANDVEVLVITEVLANATDEQTGEYVELFNPSAVPIDATGLLIADDTNTDALVGYAGGSGIIPPFEHALILDPQYAFEYALPAGVALLTIESTVTIGSGLRSDEAVSLLTSDGVTTISSYMGGMDPPDGTSIERRRYDDADDNTNWQSNPCVTGRSPGRLNSAPPSNGLCSMLQITEVMANAGDEDTGEFIEIFNAGADDVDLRFTAKFTDGDNTDLLRGFDPGITMLPAGEYAVIVDAEYADQHPIPSGTLVLSTIDTTLGNGLQTSDPITLLDETGTHVIDRFVWPFNPGNAVSIERVSLTDLDSADNWIASECGGGMSPGTENCAGGPPPVGGPAIVINEVLANALDEDTGEFVEIYNNGAVDVDLSLVILWDGDALDNLEGMTDPTDTMLAPGGYALILDPEYAGEYTIPAGTLLVVPDDTALGSGLATNDPITLLELDGVTVIDSFSWPYNAGNGISIQRDDVNAGDDAENWLAAEICTSSPGELNCQ